MSAVTETAKVETTAKSVAKALDAVIVAWEIGSVHRLADVETQAREHLIEDLVGVTVEEQHQIHVDYAAAHAAAMGIPAGDPAERKAAFAARDAIGERGRDVAESIVQDKAFYARIKRRIEKLVAEGAIEAYRYDDEAPLYDGTGAPVYSRNKEPSYGALGTRAANTATHVAVVKEQSAFSAHVKNLVTDLGVEVKIPDHLSPEDGLWIPAKTLLKMLQQ